jgi:hypothetical protein
VNYPVLDLFFVARVEEISAASALDGVESFVWRDPSEIRAEEMAFASNWDAVRRYLAGK